MLERNGWIRARVGGDSATQTNTFATAIPCTNVSHTDYECLGTLDDQIDVTSDERSLQKYLILLQHINKSHLRT